tara:strand:+ start:10672 stop:11436 length:765 start_codon:yes stop_codon:yes gene_type:complete
MRNKHIFLISIILVFIFCSCSSKKNIVLLQDVNSSNVYNNVYEYYEVKVDDILKITSVNDDIEVLSEINLSLPSNITTKEMLEYYGYMVDVNGEITYPPLGKVYVKGLTIDQVSETLSKKLLDSGIYNNPLLDVKLINGSFTIIGEVNIPGKYDFLKNNLNIFEAIGIAGGLTINGKRNDIKIIREENESKKISIINLTNTKIFDSKYFQIIPGDVIIVNPNTNRIKNAGIIGNSGTLLSLLSFILSSIIVINN